MPLIVENYISGGLIIFANTPINLKILSINDYTGNINITTTPQLPSGLIINTNGFLIGQTQQTIDMSDFTITITDQS